MSILAPKLRLVRPAPDPLGLYVRAGSIGREDLRNFIMSNGATFSGVVFEAKRVSTQKELLSLVLEKGMGLAPTHLISGPDDPWLDIDLSITRSSRASLDQHGASGVQMPYSLAMGYEAFRTLPKRRAVVEKLRRVQSNGLWLKIDGCGCDSSPTAITRYCDAATGRARSALGCRDSKRCRRGVDDMLRSPARHFLCQRTHQIAGLSRIPASLRPSQFLEELVRPASDTAVKVSALELPAELTKKLQKQTKRINALRTTLGPYARERREASFAMHPITRIARGNGC